MKPSSVKSEMDLFADLPVQISESESRYVGIPPVSAIQKDSPITVIAPKSKYYTCLNRSFFVMKFKVTKPDGSDIPEKNSDATPTDLKVSTINYIAQTAFKEVDLSINSVSKIFHGFLNYMYLMIPF